MGRGETRGHGDWGNEDAGGHSGVRTRLVRRSLGEGGSFRFGYL